MNFLFFIFFTAIEGPDPLPGAELALPVRGLELAESSFGSVLLLPLVVLMIRD